MDDILTSLNPEGLRDLPGELGAFSPESLFVRFSFTFDELDAALKAFPEGRALSEPLKTVVHESSHLFHTLTTPFGMLIYALRRFQSAMIATTIVQLRTTHGVKIRYPLIEFVLGLAPEIQQAVSPFIVAWYKCELFILQSLDLTGSWENQVVKNPILLGESPSSLFVAVQQYLATHYAHQAFNARAADGKTGPGEAPQSTYDPDRFDESDAARLDKFALTMQLMADESNAVYVYESAGTVSEYWGNSLLSLDALREELSRRSLRHGLGRAVGWRFVSRAIPAHNLLEFVLSYLALADLALFGPVLPQHRHFRKDGLKLYQVMPYPRWLELNNVVPDIRAMQSLDDYPRYTGELCAALGWVSPAEISRYTASEHAAMPGDPFEEAYVKSARYRLAVPWLFLDYGYLLSGSGPVQQLLSQMGGSYQQFLLDFNFPVVQYKDRTVYHRDKEALRAFTSYYLLRAALRAILLRDNLTLRMPYRAKNPEEVAFWRENLIGDLESVLGLRISNLTLLES